MTSIIRESGGLFAVYKKIPGYKKQYSDLCKYPQDEVYAGIRKTKEQAQELANEIDNRT